MDFEFTEEQRILRHSVLALCQAESPLASLRRAEAAEQGFSRNIWLALTNAGFTGIFVPEEYGGVPLDHVSAVILYEELGRQLAISPHLVSSYMAVSLINSCANETIKTKWLPRVAEEGLIITVAVDEPGRTATPEGVQMTATTAAGGFMLDGIKHLVPYADAAEVFLVLAHDDKSGGFGAYLVPRGTPGLTCRLQPSLANDGLYHLEFDQVRIPYENLIATDVWKAWTAVLDTGGVFAAAFAAGAAQAVLDMSSAYAKERVQFGKPIGSFQAIAHKLADMATEIEAARTLAYHAAWRGDTGQPDALAACQAKLFATEALRKAAAAGIQIHGGFGFTLEGDPQLFFRRAKHLQLSYRGPAELEDRIADLILGGGEA